MNDIINQLLKKINKRFSHLMHKNAKLLPACQMWGFVVHVYLVYYWTERWWKWWKRPLVAALTVIKEYNSVIQTCSHQRHQTSSDFLFFIYLIYYTAVRGVPLHMAASASLSLSLTSYSPLSVSAHSLAYNSIQETTIIWQSIASISITNQRLSVCWFQYSVS